LQRWKYQNGRREASCSDGNAKTVVGNVLAAMETPKRSSGNFLQRWKYQNGRREASCSAESTKTVGEKLFAAQKTALKPNFSALSSLQMQHLRSLYN